MSRFKSGLQRVHCGAAGTESICCFLILLPSSAAAVIPQAAMSAVPQCSPDFQCMGSHVATARSGSGELPSDFNGHPVKCPVVHVPSRVNEHDSTKGLGARVDKKNLARFMTINRYARPPITHSRSSPLWLTPTLHVENVTSYSKIPTHPVPSWISNMSPVSRTYGLNYTHFSTVFEGFTLCYR